ncbi:50S ribosomal protein L11 methyltransferase [Hazenella coriacea]|uniref:Ribosomal protein L11 methyltransferase n=1 Tax=Hazenella coriacea TaxID=1179467 RepID=A0A4R3L5U3_9BACL|nr:50S ribosomal protein L11 methyltransferase [Hazenella coriacea]TCS94772.1 [LSU ribosomal protein L11P]-lysine N-methyltransferase [Hazenella coriacea]
MNWIEVSVHTSHEALEAISALLQELGADGVAIEDAEVLKRTWENKYGEIIALSKDDYPEEGVIVKAYLSELEISDVEALVKQIQAGFDQLKELGLNLGASLITTQQVDEESWAHEWKNYYKPVQITERLSVKPVWEEYSPNSATEQVIELDPGMAFGTGTHPTTVLSLKLLDQYLSPSSQVIDVGCGSGILSIAAAKLGAKEVLALDLDPVAVQNAKQNMKQNRVEAIVKVEEGDLLKGVSHTADLVVANILADIILRFTFELPRVLVPGGIFIASGIIEEKEQEIVDSLTKNGLEVLEIVHQEGWVAIAAKKW